MNNPVYFDLRLTVGGVIISISTLSLRFIVAGDIVFVCTFSVDVLSCNISEVLIKYDYCTVP